MKHLLNSVMLFLCLFIWQNAWGQTVLKSGSLTGTITWKLEKTGTGKDFTLTIAGSGDMPDFTSETDVPWYKFRDSGVTYYNYDITTLNIASGITRIGNYAFNGTGIKSVEIPSVCTSIGYMAFYSSDLKELYIPTSVTSIGNYAFTACSSLALVHFDGHSTSNTSLNLSMAAQNGKIIEKEGNTTSYVSAPSRWERYTHGERCYGGAWVAECGTGDTNRKLFFYAQKPGAIVNYASKEPLPTIYQDREQYHPWRVNCEKYTSLEINRNISQIYSMELYGYKNSNTGLTMGYTNIHTITVESGNQDFVVGEDGVLYDNKKTDIRLYPAARTAKHFDIPATVEWIHPGSFLGAKNLQSINFLGNHTVFMSHSLENASSLNYIYFNTEKAPTTYSESSFAGLPNTGKVVANAKVETDAWKKLTNAIGSGWTFSTIGTTSYISDGTLYVVGNGAYTTSSEDANWYSQRSSIKKIVVKEGVTDIGSSAFANCSNVTEVTLNNSGTIGTNAFRDCSALTRVNIGGVKEFKYRIGDLQPFYGCSKLSTINTTDLKAFCSIVNLEYLTGSGMAEKTLLINGVAHSSTSVLEIPEGVTEISECAFRYFSNVTKIKFPSSIETIGIHNFAYNPYLKEITIPFTEASVGAEAFRECTSLETVTLNNTGTIGTGAFCNCSALTRVNIGGVKGFEYGIASPLPFYGCSKLSTINTTDLKAFCSIVNLEYLTGSGIAKKTLLINGVAHSSTSVLEIPEGVTEIANYAFRYFSNVTKIKFPSSIETIGFQNFAYNPYLKEITIPLTKASVGNQAFRGCTSLESVTLNNSGTIGDGAFLDCTSLTRVNIGGVKGFAKPSDYTVNPFSRCSKLATINVTDLKAFCAIENLQYLTDSNYGTAANKTLMIDGVAHPSTSNLVIPEGVTSISPCAFRYFPNVVNIKLPESMKTISSSNFADHPYLEKIILPSTLTSVGKNAFSGCTNLMRIICRATTCPSVTGSIATNPYHIILKVPAGKASLYRAADIWKEFSVSESLYRVVSMNLSNYGNPDIAGYRLVANLYDDKIYRVKNWTSTNTDIAIVNTIGRVYAEDYIYDGSTELPYKEFSIIGDLGDCDTCVWNMKLYPRQVALTDGNVYKSIKKFNCSGRISYTRTFADKVVNKWQCFYVPFDVEVTDELLEDFDFAELYMVSYFDADENGEIEDGEPLRMTFCRLYAGKTLHANTPYYVRVKSSGTKTFETTNATLMAAANGSVDCSTTKHVYSLVGIYEPTYMQGRYGMALNGGFTYVTNPTTKLGAYRWYMEVKSRTGELENLARPIEIYVEGDEETTGIVALEDKASAPQSDKVFTLDGRQVNNTDNLPSGMYIINGKKVFKK